MNNSTIKLRISTTLLILNKFNKLYSLTFIIHIMNNLSLRKKIIKSFYNYLAFKIRICNIELTDLCYNYISLLILLL